MNAKCFDFFEKMCVPPIIQVQLKKEEKKVICSTPFLTKGALGGVLTPSLSNFKIIILF